MKIILKVIFSFLVKENLTTEEQLANMQNIYTSCISEIVEIISKECQERGALLQNIWNTHISLVNACLTRYETEKTTQYSAFLSEIEKIKSSYSSTFDTLTKENKEYRVMLDDRDFLIKKLNYDVNSLKRKEQRLNKTIQNLGDAINEFKDMFDAILAENIKLKMSKEEESNLKKGEREILKKQYEDMIKHKSKGKQGIFQRVEKLMKNQTLAPSPIKELNNQKSLAFDFVENDTNRDNLGSMGTFKNISMVNIMEEENEELNSPLEGMNDLFVKEIGVDTKDLLPVNNKETTTKDLSKYFSRDQSAQTVYFDEINEEAEDKDSPDDKKLNVPSLTTPGRMRGSYVNTGDVSLENMVEVSKKDKDVKGIPIDKQFILRKRMFSFSAESLKHLDKFKEIQSYTLTGICEWYSEEICNFFNILKLFSSNIDKENFFEILEHFDWATFPEILSNIFMIHEQFIKNIKNRDTTRSKEILQHKIELLERKIEMDEAEKMRNLFRNNYNKLREKFEEFYKMTIKIQSMDEDEEDLKTMDSINVNESNFLLAKSEKLPKRRKSLTLIGNDENVKSIEEFNKKKGKTMIKKPDVKIRPIRKFDESLDIPIQKAKSGKKFEDITEKIFDSKKITSFSLKAPDEIVDKGQEKDTSNSFELKPPPTIHINTIAAHNQTSINEEEISKSFGDFKDIEVKTIESRSAMTKSTRFPPIKKVIKEKSLAALHKNVNFADKPVDIKTTLAELDKEKNEVLRMEEKQLQQQREFHDMIANEKMIDLINQANNVLPQKKSWDKINSQNSDKCYAFLHRIEVSLITSSKKVTLATVLKTISQILTELIKIKFKKQGNLNPLFFILYEFLFQRYGNIRERAEAKMIKIFQGCKTHLELPRVRIFARLLSILPEKNNTLTSSFDGNDLDFYLHYFMLLDDHPMSNIPGIMLAMSPQEHAFTALAKAIEVLTKFYGNYTSILPKIKLENIINQIKAVKLDDPIISRKYVVDADFVIEKIFEIREEVFKIYKIPFLAVDIDDNQALNINEFMLLIRNIERNKFNDKQIIELFQNEYDFYDEEKEEKCMSFKRFAFLCERENIIDLKKQESFANEINDEVKNIAQLKDEWDVKKNLIKLKLIKTNYYNSFYIRVLKLIEAHLNSKNIKSEEETRLVWLQYRIIDEESNAFLLQYETESCLPKDYNIISMKASDLF